MDKFDGVYTIEKMLISSTEKFVDPVHIIPIQMLSLVYASSLNASMCASLLKVPSLMLAPWSEMHLMWQCSLIYVFFFCLLPWSKFETDLSVNHEINLVWPKHSLALRDTEYYCIVTKSYCNVKKCGVLRYWVLLQKATYYFEGRQTVTLHIEEQFLKFRLYYKIKAGRRTCDLLASYPGSRWAGERESLVSTVCTCA